MKRKKRQEREEQRRGQISKNLDIAHRVLDKLSEKLELGAYNVTTVSVRLLDPFGLGDEKRTPNCGEIRIRYIGEDIGPLDGKVLSVTMQPYPPENESEGEKHE